MSTMIHEKRTVNPREGGAYSGKKPKYEVININDAIIKGERSNRSWILVPPGNFSADSASDPAT